MPYDKVPENLREIYLSPEQNANVEKFINETPNNAPEGSGGGALIRRALLNYYAAISGIDYEFGRLLDCLEEEGIADEELSHRIRWGDTLWRITERYYGNPYLYPLLAVENQISNPNLIIPGTEIRLPEKIDEKKRKDQ